MVEEYVEDELQEIEVCMHRKPAEAQLGRFSLVGIFKVPETQLI